MTVTRTVPQTVTGVVASYKKDIEAAAGDSVLSKAEQARLTPFAKKYIEAARVAGKPMTVTKAVAALKPVVTRAIESVAGSDRKVDEFEVANLRVPELRARAAELFVEPPTGDLAAVTRAIDAVNVPLINDYGHSFWASNAPKTSTLRSIVRGITDVDADPLTDYVSLTEGRAAIKEFSDVIRQTGQDILDNGNNDPLVDADLNARLTTLADASDKYFKEAGFQRIVFARHAIAEDGDVEYNILMGQNLDGTWKTITYSDFPF